MSKPAAFKVTLNAPAHIVREALEALWLLTGDEWDAEDLSPRYVKRAIHHSRQNESPEDRSYNLKLRNTIQNWLAYQD